MVNPGDAYGRLFNQKDYSNVTEAIFWKQYSITEGVFHALTKQLFVARFQKDKRILVSLRLSFYFA